MRQAGVTRGAAAAAAATQVRAGGRGGEQRHISLSLDQQAKQGKRRRAHARTPATGIRRPSPHVSAASQERTQVHSHRVTVDVSAGQELLVTSLPLEESRAADACCTCCSEALPACSFQWPLAMSARHCATGDCERASEGERVLPPLPLSV